MHIRDGDGPLLSFTVYLSLDYGYCNVFYSIPIIQFQYTQRRRSMHVPYRLKPYVYRTMIYESACQLVRGRTQILYGIGNIGNRSYDIDIKSIYTIGFYK